MVLKRVQYLHFSSEKNSTKEVDSKCQQYKRMYSCLVSFFLPDASTKRMARVVKWVYDHLGPIWMSLRCRFKCRSERVWCSEIPHIAL